MMRYRLFSTFLAAVVLFVGVTLAAAAAPKPAAKPPSAPAASTAALTVDDTPGAPGEFGFRPEEGQPSPVNPPGFVWRPQQKGGAAYELEVARDAAFTAVEYRAAGLTYPVHCPPRTLPEGQWHWRFRMVNKKGEASAWSKVRTFSIAKSAVAMPMPARDDLLGRIPAAHPRLFVRPEQLPQLKALAKGDLKPEFDKLVAECEKLLKNPPPTAEPPTYPEGLSRQSDEWKAIWWGNRTYTIKALDGAARLAFTRLLGGKEEYGQLARRILMDCAKWNPTGSTGYRYNDEAGMPYAYYFSRTYTYVNDLLTPEEKAKCREVMAVRGAEMYKHLCPRHLWQPYSSHSNRAWHKLGEVGIAFKDEIPEAGEWAWFAMNVFYNAYPVWCDSDGGWHEGSSYWQSYIARFSWWADVMRVAFNVNAYQKPYFSQIGYYPMYLQPPGTQGGGFGDLTPTRPADANRQLMTMLAVQAGNPYWKWYVDALGGPQPESGYIGFIRGMLPKVEAKAPDALPSSRCFRGTGQAYLNTTLKAAAENVEVLFKSSPFGTQSHGYDSQNAFMLYVAGDPLFVSTGRRDQYGSKHHADWMWNTKSVNSILVDGKSQGKRTAAARGQVLGFATSADLDYVAGEAAGAYDGGVLKRFTRHIVFVKPGLVVLFDRLEAPKPSTFQWMLHSPQEMKIAGPAAVEAASGKASAKVAFLAPAGLKLSQSNLYEPPPRRNKVTEWHLTAETAAPVARMEFVTVVRPARPGDPAPGGQTLKSIPGGYALEADVAGGRTLVLLRAADTGVLAFGGRSIDADVAAVRFDAVGKPVSHLVVRGTDAKVGAGDLPR